MNKELTPQNDEQRNHFHEILDAWLDGNLVECKHISNDESCWNIWSYDLQTLGLDRYYQYRIKPVSTPLPIPVELWKFIDKNIIYFAMDKNGEIYAFKTKPTRMELIWNTNIIDCFYFNSKVIDIDTAGINWETSLTMRPDAAM